MKIPIKVSFFSAKKIKKKVKKTIDNINYIWYNKYVNKKRTYLQVAKKGKWYYGYKKRII